MLTRRHIRIKVMQLVYAFSNGNQKSIVDKIKFIESSFVNMFDLYLIKLYFFKALQMHASEQHRISTTELHTQEKNKYLHKFIATNIYLVYLANHKQLNQFLVTRKMNQWELNFDYVKKIYAKLLESNLLSEYSEIKNPSEKEQRSFVVSMFKDIIAPDDLLYNYFEDVNINWVDDIPPVNTFLLKQLKRMDVNNQNSIDFPDLNKNKEDTRFGIDLFEKTIVNDDKLQNELEGKTPNWETKRIARLDAILIKLAIAELFYFSDIPSKVTLNEYLEIAKEYSTPKSNQFINGVLDGLVKEYEKTNRINKQGRGLL